MPTQSQVDKITEVANKLSVDPAWLYGLISLESRFNPQATNEAGSGARGLIQVMPDTARGEFGMSADELVATYPDFDSQMDNVVLPYFMKGRPYPTEQSFYMQVFFPAAKYVSADTTFQTLYQKLYPTKWQEIYPKFASQNKGIVMVADYVNLIKKRIGGYSAVASSVSETIKKSGLPIAGIIATAAGAWLFFK
jgi:hypothetical protein